MKKYIAIAIIGIAGIALGQAQTGQYKLVDDTVSGTVYVGTHQTTAGNTISTTASKWNIKRIVTSTNGVEIAEAWSTNAVQPLWTSKWSERASTNITYKVAQ